ncbi:hypothetical protein M569_05294, partial [Genlisea aurea]
PHRCAVSFPRCFSAQPESDEPFIPLQFLISLLDSYHDLTGFPWWISISSSTIIMRLALFPLVIVQLKKLKRITELLPQLPRPFPPPLSGRSFKDQLLIFMKEKNAAGCPSFLWFFSSLAIQAPCFFWFLMSIRRMSLDEHPGFDSGGLLWFQNLSDYPHGVLGSILPLSISGLHFANVKMYSIYLQALTVPILIGGFSCPQGSLVYWVTNSSLSLIQLICLHNDDVREYLGLPGKTTPSSVGLKSNEEKPHPGVEDIVILTKQGEVSARSLSPPELTSFSVKMLTDGRRDVAERMLRLALEKDPANIRALLILGQTLLQNKQLSEAVECLEAAISKLISSEGCYPTKVEDVDLLILSSQWAGIAKVQQGKIEEGIVHLERIATLAEPEDPKSKAHYYDGLLVLSSALANVNRKSESLKYLHKAAKYNPAYTVYFDHLETTTDDSNDISSDLVSSRRD